MLQGFQSLIVRKIDSVLIPQLEDYCSIGIDEAMIEKLSFLRYDGCKKLFSLKSHLLKAVMILLIMNGIVTIESNDSLDSLIRKSKRLWEKRPGKLHNASYNMLSEQIKYMSNELKNKI